MLRLDTSFLTKQKYIKKIKQSYAKRIPKILEAVKEKKALGSEMTGWIQLAENYDKKQLEGMQKKAAEWKKNKIGHIVVVGIGGSYLGARAAIEMVKPYFHQSWFQLYYVHNIHPNYLVDLLDLLGDKKFAIIVISKSGTTLEPALAFHLLREKLIKNVGKDEATDLIVAITDQNKGVLNRLAHEQNYTTFVIPDDIGGRYSALTPVGMFLMILCDLDPQEILQGARDAITICKRPDLETNTAALYAAFRHFFYTKGKKKIENFAVYDPSLVMLTKVYTQIFAESEGKNEKGLYTTTSLFTTDLHSLGQYIQEGEKNFFETILYVSNAKQDQIISISKDSDDELHYLNGKSISFVNKIAFSSTSTAHSVDGHIDNLVIFLDKQDAYHFGFFYQWICFAAMFSGYLLKINPFDQPGVEAYKKRMFATLKLK